MNDSLYIAATGMQAQQLNIDSIANNLANISTTGFKKSRINFQEMMHIDPAQGQAGQAGQAGISGTMGLGISVSSVTKDFSSAPLTQTGAPMDLAINGAGFLEVVLADGSRGYTRAGTLQVTRESYLATANGNLIKPSIHIPANASAIQIAADGKVSVQTGTDGAFIDVGQLELANFANPAALNQVAGGVYAPTAASGEAVYGKAGTQGMGTLAQGALEGSNVNMVDEMVTLMVAQRAYEMSSKVIQASDELMSLTNNLRR